MGYVREFLNWFNAQPNGTQGIVLLLLAGLVLPIVGWLIRRVVREWSSPRPSLLLMEPEEWQYVRWVPLESFAVRWSSRPDVAESAKPRPRVSPEELIE